MSRDPLPSKGKNFDTRFGLIHVQTGKKFFCQGTPPPLPPVKGKIFDTRFGLIHVQTGKKFYVEGPSPPGIARTCYGYAAGGMPLAFTQEDFLVICVIVVLFMKSRMAAGADPELLLGGGTNP